MVHLSHPSCCWALRSPWCSFSAPAHFPPAWATAGRGHSRSAHGWTDRGCAGVQDHGGVRRGLLLFTIGLNFSLPQLHALRGQVLGLGTGQVVFTTAWSVPPLGWRDCLPLWHSSSGGCLPSPPPPSSAASWQNKKEENPPHGGFGLAMSVFQDVTAVPFLVVIPVLGMAVGADILAVELGWAMVKACWRFPRVLHVGRWLLRPLFPPRHAAPFCRGVYAGRIAGGIARCLDDLQPRPVAGVRCISAGMMLGETEFRHQVESSIRLSEMYCSASFSSVSACCSIRRRSPHMALGLAWRLAAVGEQILLVAAMVKKSGIGTLMAWRTALLLAVGGEFGFALLAIASMPR